MLNIQGDKFICSLVTLSGFGEGCFAGNSVDDTIIIQKPCAVNFEEFKEACLMACKRFDENAYTRYKISLMAIVQATTSDLQPLAKRHLEKLGFKSSGEYARAKYTRDGGLTVWTMGARDFCVAIGYKTQEEVDKLLNEKPSIKNLKKVDTSYNTIEGDWDSYAYVE